MAPSVNGNFGNQPVTYRAISLTLLMFIFQCQGQSSRFNFVPNLPKEESYISFCSQGKLYGFSSNVCPGGINFKLPKAFESDSCFCTNGYFIVGDDNAVYHSSGEYAQKQSCFRPSTINKLFALQGSTTSFIFPLTFGNLSEEVVSFTENFEHTRKYRVAQLRAVNNTPHFKSDILSFQSFFVNPVGPESRATVLYAGGSPIVDFDTIELNRDVSGKPWGKSYAVVISDIGNKNKETISVESADWILSNYGVPLQKWDYEENRANTIDDECTQTCTVTPESWVTDPLKSYIPVQTQPQLHKHLVAESKELLEYRMRITQQNARIKKTAEYPRGLDIIAQAAKIFEKLSANMVTTNVIDMAYRLFEYLYHDKYPRGQLTDRHYSGISYALQKCADFVRPLSADLFVCPNKSPVSSNISFEKTVEKNRLYNPDKNDMIIELVWKALDAVHMTCFPYFSFDAALHHDYGVEIIRLFTTRPVQQRWVRAHLSENQQKGYQIILPGLNREILELADDTLQVIVNMKNVYDNPLRKPEMSFEDDSLVPDIGECPGHRSIWGGLGCCLEYDMKTGPVPEFYRFLSTDFGLAPTGRR